MSTQAEIKAALNRLRGNPSQQEYAEAVRNNSQKIEAALKKQTFTHTVGDITISCNGTPANFKVQTPHGFEFNRNLEQCIQELLTKTSEVAIETAITVGYSEGELQEVVTSEQSV
jgi:hypothetical protein